MTQFWALKSKLPSISRGQEKTSFRNNDVGEGPKKKPQNTTNCFTLLHFVFKKKNKNKKPHTPRCTIIGQVATNPI